MSMSLIPLPNIRYASAPSVIEMRRPAARGVQLTGHDSELRFGLQHADTKDPRSCNITHYIAPLGKNLTRIKLVKR